MGQPVLKSACMSKIRASVRDNLKTYLKGEWRFQKEDFLQKTDLRSLDLAEVKFLDPEGSGKKSHDYENAVSLFEFWKDMNPTQAESMLFLVETLQGSPAVFS